MKNYILHIGLPKTGTTTLQRYYFPKLQQPSICYNPSSIIDPLVQALKLLDFGALKEEDMKFLNNVVKWQSNKIPQKNILISLEILSQRLLKFDFVERGRFLKSIFPNATIVLVLRYQPELLRSLYQQHVHQNYFLMPEEVFIPFAKHVFPETDHWKARMQINVKEWDYKETIKYFRHCYGKQFHVLFFENHSKNILDMGRSILKFAGFHVDNGRLNSFLTKTNVSYDSTIMSMVLNITHRKLAFHSNTGFDSLHIQDLMEQANQARFIFDSDSITNFLSRLEDQQHVSRSTCSKFDKQLLRIIKTYSKLRNNFKSQRYELPEIIRSYLEQESKILNSSLNEVVDRQKIPKQYL